MKKFIILLFALFMTFVMISCSSSKSETTDSSSENKTPISIAMHPYVHSVPGIYAEQNGLYDDFDVASTMYASGPVQNEAISSDAWEVGTAGVGGGILGASSYGMKIIGYVGDESDTTDLWVRADSHLLKQAPDANKIYGIKEQWKGLDIICGSGTTCQMILIATLEHLDLTQNDINVIDMSVPQSFAAFKAGEGDVVALWSPFGIYAEREGWVRVSSAKRLKIGIPSIIVATEKAVNERPEIVQKWLQVYLESAEILENDPALASNILFEYQKSEGIRVDEDSAAIDIQDRGFSSIAQNKKLFAKKANGTSEMYDMLITFAEFLQSEGKITEVDKQRIINENFVDDTFVNNLTDK